MTDSQYEFVNSKVIKYKNLKNKRDMILDILQQIDNGIYQITPNFNSPIDINEFGNEITVSIKNFFNKKVDELEQEMFEI
ncbi:hypothetical protein [Clostridium sporogenes]|uniref:hypothetical protein n=1 Tax=Clostridium sporogenes TaxID=1509 RepID=UPI0013D5B849|nr:hypothetical protein [Clostridium sporogenes]NFF75941.1 hypothetical protein [Clostridium sporogenes]NFH40841.1 hypothetical protein [Clostridium sporogenes]